MKAVLFDVDDTLYDQLHPFQRAYEKHFNFPNVSIEMLYILSRKYSDEVFHLSESGDMTMEEMYRYRIGKALAYFDHEITSEKAMEFQKTYQQYQQLIELTPDMINALNYCKEKQVILGIITNGPLDHQKRKINQLHLKKWIPESNIFISSEIGVAKPDPEIFYLAEKKLKLNKKNTYFVGDSFQNDIIGAKSAGWKAIWSNQRNHPEPTTIVKPDYIINNKKTLLEVLEELL